MGDRRCWPWSPRIAHPAVGAERQVGHVEGADDRHAVGDGRVPLDEAVESPGVVDEVDHVDGDEDYEDDVE